MNILISHQTLFIVAAFLCVLLLFVLEQIYPLRRRENALFSRLLINGVLALLTFVTAISLVRPGAEMAMKWTEDHSLGLLNIFEFPFWAKVILSFVMMDISFYYWHWLNHKASWLWRFHNVHHVDPELDVSTGFRFHFGEVAFSTIFRIFQVIIIGPTLEMYLLYEFIFQLSTLFHHSNIGLPKDIDKMLNQILVTPRMHTIHHSNFHQETDSNFSVVLSFWDRLHGTFKQDLPSGVTIGVPGYSSRRDNTLMKLILIPFQKQRDYWQGRERRPEISSLKS